MDFSTIDLAANADRGADCHLEHPVTEEPLFTDDGKPVTIRVLGQDSREFRAAVAAIADKARTGKQTLDKAEANAIELLSRVVVRWEGIVWDGKPLDCTPENVRMFLSKFPPIRRQLDEFIGNRANFFRAGAKK
jgi:hypothetical protein